MQVVFPLHLVWFSLVCLYIRVLFLSTSSGDSSVPWNSSLYLLKTLLCPETVFSGFFRNGFFLHFLNPDKPSLTEGFQHPGNIPFPALDLHNNGAVPFIPDPSGAVIQECRLLCAPAEPDALDTPGECIPFPYSQSLSLLLQTSPMPVFPFR